jgi:hypothetical protein
MGWCSSEVFFSNSVLSAPSSLMIFQGVFLCNFCSLGWVSFYHQIVFVEGSGGMCFCFYQCIVAIICYAFLYSSLFPLSDHLSGEDLDFKVRIFFCLLLFKTVLWEITILILLFASQIIVHRAMPYHFRCLHEFATWQRSIFISLNIKCFCVWFCSLMVHPLFLFSSLSCSLKSLKRYQDIS